MENYLESIVKEVRENDPSFGPFRYETGLHRSTVHVGFWLRGDSTTMSLTPRRGEIGLRGSGTTIGRWNINEATMRLASASQGTLYFSGDWCLTDSEMSALIAQTGDGDVHLNAQLRCDVVMDQPQAHVGLHYVEERMMSKRFARSDWAAMLRVVDGVVIADGLAFDVPVDSPFATVATHLRNARGGTDEAALKHLREAIDALFKLAPNGQPSGWAPPPLSRADTIETRARRIILALRALTHVGAHGEIPGTLAPELVRGTIAMLAGFLAYAQACRADANAQFWT